MTPQPLHWQHVAILAAPIPGVGRLCIIRNSAHGTFSKPTPEEMLTIETERPDLLAEVAARDAADVLRAAEAAKQGAETAIAAVADSERQLEAREEGQRQTWIERNGELARREAALADREAQLADIIRQYDERLAAADAARIAAEHERAGVLAMFRAAGGAAA